IFTDKGVVWLRVDGIPLHLRSIDLFRKLGNVCGGFVDFNEDGCSLNAVRIKVNKVGVIPHRFPVLFEETRSILQVVVENQWCFTEG
ncbi:hypothetical protein LINGRAHAP2_LOCUS14059, partial [Linum grandiflorum]